MSPKCNPAVLAANFYTKFDKRGPFVRVVYHIITMTPYKKPNHTHTHTHTTDVMDRDQGKNTGLVFKMWLYGRMDRL